MNNLSIHISWVGWFLRPGLRKLEDRSLTPPRLVGVELLLFGFNCGLFLSNFKISNYQVGCHIAKSYFASIVF